MSENTSIQPPQPIPYPKSHFIKTLYRIPIQLYRLGLGPLIGKYILILSTTGRKTGKIHRTPVEFFRYNDCIYVMSGFGTTPDWYRNLLEDPHASLELGRETLHVIAKRPDSQSEWAGVIAFLKSSPVTRIIEPDLVNQLDTPQMQDTIKTWPILTFVHTNETCPASLERDLLWTWPLILMGTAFLLLRSWLCTRKRESIIRHQRFKT